MIYGDLFVGSCKREYIETLGADGRAYCQLYAEHALALYMVTGNLSFDDAGYCNLNCMARLLTVAIIELLPHL